MAAPLTPHWAGWSRARRSSGRISKVSEAAVTVLPDQLTEVRHIAFHLMLEEGP